MKNIIERVEEKFIKFSLLFATIISILITFGILFSILFEAIRFFELRPLSYFFTGVEWSPGIENSKFGALPLFLGTFLITIIAMIVAIPIGLGSAIYMSEYASFKTRTKLKPLQEMLASIPTVVYGFFALLVVAPFIVKVSNFFGFEASFNSSLASGIVMGIMIIPLISSLSDDAINAVPTSQRRASLALGMTKSETITNIVLPSAMPGIISAILLAFSKALGETMIVVMAAGARPNLTMNPFDDMMSVTVSIVNTLVSDHSFSSAESLSAFALGLVLFFATLIINIISVIMIRKFKKKYKVNTL